MKKEKTVPKESENQSNTPQKRLPRKLKKRVKKTKLGFSYRIGG